MNAENFNNEEEWQDILGNGDVKRKVLIKSSLEVTESKPINGDTVVVDYIEKTYSNGEITDSKNKFEFTLGDGDVLPVLDMGVKLMFPNEVSIFLVEPRFAYGKYGSEPKIDAYTKMSYEITLVEVKDGPEYDKLPIDELLKFVEAKKNRGNWWYGREEYGYAIDSYSRGLKILENFEKSMQTYTTNSHVLSGKTESGSAKHEDKMISSQFRSIYDELDITLHNNLAAAQLKIEAFDAVLRSLDYVLKLRPTDVKALYRMSKVLTGKGDIVGSLNVLETLMELEPGNKAFASDAAKLNKVKLKHDTDEKMMCQKMFKSTPTTNNNSELVKSPKKLYTNFKAFLSDFPHRLRDKAFQHANSLFAIFVALTSLVLMYIGMKCMDWFAPQASIPV